MINMSTPHNSANIGDIAETVIMCGDPLRIKYIAETYLENAVCFNEVRGMLGYTGYYNGKRVSVMGHGMGMASIGIYAYELYNHYGVKQIIRAGSAGGIGDGVNVRDIIIAQGVCHDSNFAWQYELPGTFAPIADFELLKAADAKAKELGINARVGNIYSTDVFYAPEKVNAQWKEMGILGVEMEAAALYMIAAKAKAKALCVCTVSNHMFTKEELSTEERQTGFNEMIKLCLEIA
ncbi:MAG: purine-nucleoside phosphorylase [Ruminococcaceae bacterium]|nr:purine-nucleoside phosphorylase [Oscillospiraceae bacterium]